VALPSSNNIVNKAGSDVHPTKQLKKATVRKEDKDRGEPKKHPNGY
jgi:hypothetical protein